MASAESRSLAIIAQGRTEATDESSNGNCSDLMRSLTNQASFPRKNVTPYLIRGGNPESQPTGIREFSQDFLDTGFRRYDGVGLVRSPQV